VCEICYFALCDEYRLRTLEDRLLTRISDYKNSGKIEGCIQLQYYLDLESKDNLFGVLHIKKGKEEKYVQNFCDET
jgi:hypothetical protein